MASAAVPQEGEPPAGSRPGGTVIVGLGSPILRDDAVGLQVTRALAERLPPDEFVAVEAGVAGLSLLPLLEGRDRAIIVDGLVRPPGEGPVCPGRLHQLSPEHLTATVNLAGSHNVGLAEALVLGQRLGLDMPRQVVIFGIEVRDPFTFDEQMSPDLAARVEALADEIAGRCGDTELDA